MIELNGLSKSFGRHTVLRDCTARLDRIVALRGQNGCGKTTLLRLLAGRLRPTDGTVAVNGRDPLGFEGRQSVAYVPVDAPLFPELTAAQNVTWWTRMHGAKQNANVLRDAGLGRLAHHRASVLSRGQKQRVALAIAFATQATTLLLDEPASGLDDAGRQWLQDALAEFAGTAVMAVHDDETAQLAHSTLTLAGGQLA